MSGPIDSLTMDVANKSLDAIWMRSSVISNNISNVDTPDYKEKDVAFENLLANEVDRDNTLTSDELDSIQPETVTVPGEEDANGNSVDLESQMVELTRNQLQYQYMSRAMTTNMDMLMSSASEGRK